ncbi:MAG: hypothetical protein ACO33A_05305 [Hyphomonas sp.]
MRVFKSGLITLSLVPFMLAGGCSDPAGTGAAGAGAPAPQSGYAVGRVTMEDASPLRGDIQDVSVSISGISDAAENVSYQPVVSPEGVYRQRLAPGEYAFSLSHLTVVHEGRRFRLPLEPTGSLSRKSRNADSGIVQDFVWKVSGPTPYGIESGLSQTNHTHWYGMSISVRADTWRSDTGSAPRPIPDGAALSFTLQPLSASISGDTLQPVTLERIQDHTFSAALNDIIPATYELSGSVTLPDGSQRPLLLKVAGNSAYTPSVRITPEPDGLVSSIRTQLVNYVID